MCSGITSKLRGFVICLETATSEFEGFSSITSYYAIFPNSALSVGSLITEFSLEIKFISYHISPNFS